MKKWRGTVLVSILLLSLCTLAWGEREKKSTEIKPYRTRYSKLYRNEDGSKSIEVSTQPLHYQAPDGSWREYDLRLTEEKNGKEAGLEGSGYIFANTGSELESRFSRRAGNGIMVKSGVHRLYMGLEKTDRAAKTVKAGRSSVLYRGVYRDVDLQYTLGQGYLKEDLILRKPSAAREFTFLLKAPGLDLVQDKSGAILAMDGKGKTIFTMARPFMVDKAGARSDAVGMWLEKRGARYRLRLEPDRAWLAAPERRYPVSVDPTTYSQVYGTYVSGEHNANRASTYILYIPCVGVDIPAGTIPPAGGYATVNINHPHDARPKPYNVLASYEYWIGGSHSSDSWPYFKIETGQPVYEDGPENPPTNVAVSGITNNLNGIPIYFGGRNSSASGNFEIQAGAVHKVTMYNGLWDTAFDSSHGFPYTFKITYQAEVQSPDPPILDYLPPEVGIFDSLTWSVPSDPGGSGVKRYIVQRSTMHDFSSDVVTVETANSQPITQPQLVLGEAEGLAGRMPEYRINAMGLDATGSSYEIKSASASTAIQMNKIGVQPPWAHMEIGNPLLRGAVSQYGTTPSDTRIDLSASGTDIWGASDQCGYVYQKANGDAVFTVKLESVTAAVDPNASCGIMFRQGLEANSRNVSLLYRPNNGLRIQWRTTDGGSTGSTLIISNTTLPVWIRLTRTGNDFIPSYSYDGTEWVTPVGTNRTVTMGSMINAGLAVNSRNTGQICVARFQSPTLTGNTSGTVPPPWDAHNTGNVAASGSVAYNQGSYTIQGSSGGWGTTDGLFDVHQEVSGTGSIITYLGSHTYVNTGAKAGLMYREKNTNNSRYVFLGHRPNAGIVMMWRDTEGYVTGSSTLLANPAPQLPIWLRLERVSSNTFRASYSTNGNTWSTPVDHTIPMILYTNSDDVTVEIPMPDPIRVGLAVASNTSLADNTAVFQHVNTSWDSMDPAAFYLSSSQVQLRWRDITDNETSFVVERRDTPTGNFTTIATLDAGSTSYTDTVNNHYYYRVIAVDNDENPLNPAVASTWSNTVSAMYRPTILLSRNKPAFAYSVYNSTRGTGNVNDGDTATLWSVQPVDPQWAYIDLGAQSTLDYVTVNWYTDFAANYRIETSDDAVTWTQVYSTTSGDGGLDKIIFGTTVRGRYVRLYCVTRATVREFEIYGQYGGNDIPSASAPGITPGTPVDVRIYGPSATPTLNWTYSDPNGRPQQAVQIALIELYGGLSDTQTFDPVTIQTGANSVVLPYTLRDGGNYRVAVSVSNGDTWSDFSAFQEICVFLPAAATTSYAADLTWRTHTLAKMKVRYWPDGHPDGDQETSYEDPATLTHHFQLVDLMPHTTYDYEIYLYNAGDPVMLTVQHFTTDRATDVSYTSITNKFTSETSVTINWSTKKASGAPVKVDSIVEISTYQNLANATIHNLQGQVSEHELSIDNLSPGTTYYYRLNSSQANADPTVYSLCTSTKSGPLLVDEIWITDWEITGDLTVPAGLTLHIMRPTGQPTGTTTIVFDPGTRLIVEGTLIVDPGVKFTGALGTTGCWGGIEIASGGSADINEAIIEYATRGLTCQADSQAAMRYTTFSRCKVGLHCFAATINVTGCSFIENTIYGIKEDNGGNPQVTGSYFQGNGINYYDEFLTELTLDEMSGMTGAWTSSKLTGLTCSYGAMEPLFSSTTFGYTTVVGSDVETITVTPTAEDPNSTIKVNGVVVAGGTPSQPIPIAAPGTSTIITVKVFPRVGVSTEYSVTVNRASSAYLTSLEVRKPRGFIIAILPSFSRICLSYTADVEYSTTSIQIRPTSEDPGATITINGIPATSGQLSSSINLDVGVNTILVVVTSVDGSEQRTYIIAVNRAGP